MKILGTVRKLPNKGAWQSVMCKSLNRYVNSDNWTSDEDIRVFLESGGVI